MAYAKHNEIVRHRHDYVSHIHKLYIIRNNAQNPLDIDMCHVHGQMIRLAF